MIQTRMMIDPNAKTRRGGGKHLGIRRGEILEVIEFTNKDEMLCRDTKGKCKSARPGNLRAMGYHQGGYELTYPVLFHRWLRTQNSSTAPVSVGPDWGWRGRWGGQGDKVTFTDQTVLSARETEVYDDVGFCGM